MCALEIKIITHNDKFYFNFQSNRRTAVKNCK